VSWLTGLKEDELVGVKYSGQGLVLLFVCISDIIIQFSARGTVIG
jgi:hypothetical protein